jgi:hypothetical protein
MISTDGQANKLFELEVLNYLANINIIADVVANIDGLLYLYLDNEADYNTLIKWNKNKYRAMIDKALPYEFMDDHSINPDEIEWFEVSICHKENDEIKKRITMEINLKSSFYDEDEE